MKGILITFEGIDGCGKSTQATHLAESLASLGYSVLFLREPGGTKIGERIRSILLDSAHTEMSDFSELFLYLASRAQITAERIRPALATGTVVILDRFIDSTCAYQGHARGLGLDCVRDLNRIATGGIVPDITFLFDCDPSVAVSRRTSAPDRLESEGLDFMHRVREGFLTLYSQEPDRIVLLDGGSEIPVLSGLVRERSLTVIREKAKSFHD